MNKYVNVPGRGGGLTTKSTFWYWERSVAASCAHLARILSIFSLMAASFRSSFSKYFDPLLISYTIFCTFSLSTPSIPYMHKKRREGLRLLDIKIYLLQFTNSLSKISIVIEYYIDNKANPFLFSNCIVEMSLSTISRKTNSFILIQILVSSGLFQTNQTYHWNRILFWSETTSSIA